MDDDNDTITIFRGEYLAEILQECHISATFQNEEITENYIIYNFNVAKITDLAKIKRALFIMSEFLKTTVIENNKNKSNCNLSIKIVRDERGVLPFWNAYNRMNQQPLQFLIGSDNGIIIDENLDNVSSMLCCGEFGSGKSTFIHSFLLSLMANTPSELLEVVLIDLKKIKLLAYENSPNLRLPVATDLFTATQALRFLIKVMENRYQQMNAKGLAKIGGKTRRILLVVEELADLVRSSRDTKILPYLMQLCLQGRTVGIHCLLCTQVPSSALLPISLQINTPTKFALRTASTRESVVAIGHKGCESLLGKGDMLYKPCDRVEEINLQVPLATIQHIKEFLSDCPQKPQRLQLVQPIYNPKPKPKGLKNRVKAWFKKWFSIEVVKNEEMTTDDLNDIDSMDD